MMVKLDRWDSTDYYQCV